MDYHTDSKAHGNKRTQSHKEMNIDKSKTMEKVTIVIQKEYRIPKEGILKGIERLAYNNCSKGLIQKPKYFDMVEKIQKKMIEERERERERERIYIVELTFIVERCIR